MGGGGERIRWSENECFAAELLAVCSHVFVQKSSVLAEEIVSFAIDVYLLMVGKDSISQRTDVLRSREQQ